MTSDIIASFELDKIVNTSKVIVIKEINRCDSSFISSCFLGHCIKHKFAILLVSTNNSLEHYHNVGLKMNYNLQKSITSGMTEFYDAGEEFVNVILKEENHSPTEFWIKINEKITKLYEKYGAVNVIFEGVSHLFDIKFTLKEVNEMFKNLIDLIRNYNNSFLAFHCNIASDGDVTNILANSLCHKSDIVAEVENLPSGLSADVTGRITMKYLYYKYEIEHFYTLEPKQSQYLFRLFDRGVKLLAPGTV